MNLDNLIFFILIVLIVGVVVVLGILILRQLQVSEGDQEKSKIRVLVIDSDANARETLVKFLSFEKTLEIIGAASSGKAAIERAIQLNPTVILLDLSLPDMEGIAVAKTVSQVLPGMRYVFTREHSMSEPKEWGLERPEILIKPVDYRELIKAIQQAARYK